MSYLSRFYSPREIVLVHMTVNNLASSVPYLDARSCHYDREGAYGSNVERQLLAHGYSITSIREAFATLITDEEIEAYNASLSRKS